MKVKEIYVEMGATRSANFQSNQKRVGLRADLADGDDAEECVRELHQGIKKMLLPSFEQGGEEDRTGQGGSRK